MRPVRAALTACLATALVGIPVVTFPAVADDAPHPVSSDVDVIPLDPGEPDVAAAAAPRGARGYSVTTDVDGGALVGVSWSPGADASAVQVRVRDDEGVWGSWDELPLEDGGPDADTAEGRAAVEATQAMWVDDVEDVEVRVPVGSAEGASLAVVDPGESSADATPGPSTPAATAAAAGVRPVVYSRADWGADESKRTCQPTLMSTIKGVTLHHTADADNDYTAEAVPQMLRSIYAYHTGVQKWCDVGYNFLVDRFGRIWEGRAGGADLAVQGAHAGGFNNYTVGISIIGDYRTRTPSAIMLEGVSQVMAWKLDTYRLDPRGRTVLTSAGGGTAKVPAGQTADLPVIFAHRDVGYTECPGLAAYGRMDAIRGRVVEILGTRGNAVYERWSATGGASGPLGTATTGETSTGDGRGTFQMFRGGAIFWSPSTGARDVQGGMRDRYAATGWERGPLGYPTTNHAATSDTRGRFQLYQGGAIFWSPETGAHDVQSGMRDRYAATGWERGPLGYPTTDHAATSDGRGRFQFFRNGAIFWSPETGVHDLQGAVRDRYAATGWERGSLGYPTTDHAATSDGRGRFQFFRNGAIFWSPETGAHDLQGAVRDRYAATGWERGPLGYPTTDHAATSDGRGRFQFFRNGAIFWSPETGAHDLQGAVRDRYAAMGWERGPLGYPTSDAYAVPGGSRTDFQHGQLTDIGGVVTVTSS